MRGKRRMGFLPYALRAIAVFVSTSVGRASAPRGWMNCVAMR
jgi:hypothetical protein